MLRSYKYQLDPNDTQKQWLAGAFGSARYVYNRALEEMVKAYACEKKRKHQDVRIEQ